MNYKSINKIDEEYLISNPDKGAVSILTATELIMFTLFQEGNKKNLENFIVQMGTSSNNVENIASSFTSKLKKEGWLRKSLPVNNGELLSIVYLNLTDACNYRCVYCYQGKAMIGNPLNNFMTQSNVEYIVSKIKTINPNSKILLTGGEPFLHKDILSICKYIEELEMKFSILTNGSLIDDDTAFTLSKFIHLTNVQISIDGMSEKVHNLTRGNTFHKTIKGINTIIKHKVPFSLAPTMHDKNLKDMTKIAHFAFENNGGFTPNNLRNFPQCPLDGFSLSDENFLPSIQGVERHLLANFSNEMITKQRLRTFISNDSDRDHCVCGTAHEIMDINWNGDVHPCHLLRDKKLTLGNFLSDDIEKIVLNADKLKIRKKTFEIEKCSDCHFMSLCGGGCKAAAYYEFGTFQKEDPLCAVLYENELNHIKGR